MTFLNKLSIPFNIDLSGFYKDNIKYFNCDCGSINCDCGNCDCDCSQCNCHCDCDCRC